LKPAISSQFVVLPTLADTADSGYGTEGREFESLRARCIEGQKPQGFWRFLVCGIVLDARAGNGCGQLFSRLATSIDRLIAEGSLPLHPAFEAHGAGVGRSQA
jgi:hypothetical protein